MSRQHLAALARSPLFFERNRVFRIYRGGKLFGDFFGDPPADGSEPEEWIASSVKALNRVPKGEKEGISRLRGTEVYLDELLCAEGQAVLGERSSLGILVKLLDSAMRLPVQAHPDKAFSRRHFASDYGKAEAWLVLATRENACLYFGFRDSMTPEAFAAACRRSAEEPHILEPLLNRLPAAPGDVFFIPAGMVHAIGPGCLILEIQEPTDFTLQPEAWCGDYRLSEYEMRLGLSEAEALECFDFETTGAAAVAKARITPLLLEQREQLTVTQLIGPRETDCFGLRRITLGAGADYALLSPAVYVVTAGSGTLLSEGRSSALRKGDYFLLPACLDRQARVSGTMELIQCLPPEQSILC